MAVSVTSLTPGRGRTGDSLVIDGTGFSAAAGQNTVTVDGNAAAITAESATQITATVPAGLTTDRHVDVVVTNLDDATQDTMRWWASESVAALRARAVALTFPGKLPSGWSDLAGAEDPVLCQAETVERLIGYANLVGDLFRAGLGVITRGDTGLVHTTLVGVPDGRRLRRRNAQPGGVAWEAGSPGYGLRTMHFGGAVGPGAAEYALIPNGAMGQGLGGASPLALLPETATVTRVCVIMTCTAPDVLDRVRVRAGGATIIYDSGIGQAVPTLTGYTADVGSLQAAGTSLELLATKAGSSAVMNFYGALQVSV